MKINWGTGIVLAFVTFISFILYFVITTLTDKTYNYELVTPKYYEKELKFQQQINHQKNTQTLSKPVDITKVGAGVAILIPNEQSEMIHGTIHFYRPSNEKLDFSIPIHSKENLFQIGHQKGLAKGKWLVQISWYYEKDVTTQYYEEQVIFF